jgi:hypothetical protein
METYAEFLMRRSQELAELAKLEEIRENWMNYHISLFDGEITPEIQDKLEEKFRLEWCKMIESKKM